MRKWNEENIVNNKNMMKSFEQQEYHVSRCGFNIYQQGDFVVACYETNDAK
jgi:hypothetical protein